MLLIFFTFPVLFFVIVIYIISWQKWSENKKMITLATSKSHKLFTDLKISSVNYGKLKSSMGFQVKAQLFLLDNFLIITSPEMNIKLFHTTLPIILKNNQGNISKVKMTSWGTIFIAFKKDTFSLGKANIELLVEGKDKGKLLEIFHDLKDWN